MVSRARIQLDSRKSVPLFKGIICDDISEFKSHMPSQAVPSLTRTEAGDLLAAAHKGELARRPCGGPLSQTNTMRLVGNNRRCKITCKFAVLPQEIVRHVPREPRSKWDRNHAGHRSEDRLPSRGAGPLRNRLAAAPFDHAAGLPLGLRLRDHVGAAIRPPRDYAAGGRVELARGPDAPDRHVRPLTLRSRPSQRPHDPALEILDRHARAALRAAVAPPRPRLRRRGRAKGRGIALFRQPLRLPDQAARPPP